MKKINLLIIAIASITSTAIGQNDTKDSTIIKELIQFENRYIQSFKNNDSAFLDRILFDSYTETYADGFEINKKQVISKTSLPKSLNLRVDIYKMEVIIYGNTAVLKGVYENHIRDKENTYHKITSVYAKQTNKWKKISMQYSTELVAWQVRELREKEFDALKKIACEDASKIKSDISSVRCVVRVKNNSKEQVSVQWQNSSNSADGSNEQVRIVQAGAFLDIYPFTSSTINITSSGKCLGLYAPTSKPGIVVVK